MKLIIQSQLRTNFFGWDERTVYELDNGSTWILIEPYRAVILLYRPFARVYQCGENYHLEFVGAGEMREVHPLTPWAAKAAVDKPKTETLPLQLTETKPSTIPLIRNPGLIMALILVAWYLLLALCHIK